MAGECENPWRIEQQWRFPLPSLGGNELDPVAFADNVEVAPVVGEHDIVHPVQGAEAGDVVTELDESISALCFRPGDGLLRDREQALAPRNCDLPVLHVDIEYIATPIRLPDYIASFSNDANAFSVGWSRQ
jgi:hypothetical protein